MNVILHDTFRNKLGEALRLTNTSQSQLAREMGVTPQYVHGYLVGHNREPCLSVVERFANALSIPPYALLDERPIEDYLKVTA